jgi:hypothetical protein
MFWLLTITIMANGAETKAPVGVLQSQSLCEAAGAGVAYSIINGTPGATVAWDCEPIKQEAA